jgi:hypothetical protein
MWFRYANVRGDHSVEFSFSFLFPKFMRSYVEKITGAFLYPIMVKISGRRLALRATPDITCLYAPKDSGAAAAALASLFGDPVCLGVEEDERSKALRDLDDRIAALTTASTTPGSSELELATV